jgi:alpha-beta hydrolase superfamily lysophospholipase
MRNPDRFLGSWISEHHRVERKFITSGDVQIYYSEFTPLNDAWAAMVIVHGFGEHQGRYIHVRKSHPNKVGIVVR